MKESFFAVRREHVSYAYDKRSDSENPISEKNVLNDVSLSIKLGQTVALVGSSGSGKTTVSRLAARIKWLYLYCPKCRQKTFINTQQINVTVIKEPDAQTQSR